MFKFLKRKPKEIGFWLENEEIEEDKINQRMIHVIDAAFWPTPIKIHIEYTGEIKSNCKFGNCIRCLSPEERQQEKQCSQALVDYVEKAIIP